MSTPHITYIHLHFYW